MWYVLAYSAPENTQKSLMLEDNSDKILRPERRAMLKCNEGPEKLVV